MNGQPPELPKSTSRKQSVPALLAGGIAFVIAAVVAWKVTNKAMKGVWDDQSSEAAPARSAPSVTWAHREFGDISLEAPFPLDQNQDMSAQMPAQMHAMMEEYQVFSSGDSTNPRATVTRMTYKPGIELSLDGAVTGSMNGATAAVAKGAGGAAPQFTSAKVTIDGLPARRASYSGRTQTTAFHIDAVFIQSGQTLWHVQMIYPGDSAAATSQRILDSIHIQSAR